MPQEHCSDCGGQHPHNNPNPLDCNAQTIGCDNPCRVSPKNTPACETLPSQIENFTIQFFGTVVKTEVDGKVVWSLPCNLDVGLPNNPRGVDEGLACYFLRLFHDGIVGLTGPAGPAGQNGTNGNNAFTVTLKGFTQPTIASPIVQVTTQFNPAIIAGIYVNIATSGWYLVNEVDGNGTLLLTLVKSSEGASGTIAAGKLVVPSGFPGASITGPPGPQGTVGPQGNPGASFTTTNGLYYALVGTDFNLPLLLTAVTFVNSSPQVLLPTPGTYLVTVVAGLAGQSGVATSDVATLKLSNTSNSSILPGSTAEISGLISGQVVQSVITVTVQTDAANQTIALFGECSTASKVAVRALHTTMTYVRLQ